MTLPNTQEGRRNRLDHLLNRLVDAEASIGFYQRESEKLRKEIHELLDGMEQLATEAKGESATHEQEVSRDGGFRCTCGAWFSKAVELMTHIRALGEEEPEPYRYHAGDGHP